MTDWKPSRRFKTRVRAATDVLRGRPVIFGIEQTVRIDFTDDDLDTGKLLFVNYSHVVARMGSDGREFVLDDGRVVTAPFVVEAGKNTTIAARERR